MDASPGTQARTGVLSGHTTPRRGIGMGERQTQRYLAELERNKLIRRLARLLGHGQTSSAYGFLWYPIFASATTKVSPEGVTDLSPEGMRPSSPKENQSEEIQFEEKSTDKRISGYASQKPRSAASSSVMRERQPQSELPKADEEEPGFSDPNRQAIAPQEWLDATGTCASA
jgi:hypothetical protein